MRAILVVLLAWLAVSPCFAEVSDELLDALTRRENKANNVHAVGDRNMHHRAYGLLQIRQPYLTDVNRIVGKKRMTAKWGKASLTLADVKDPETARWAAREYLTHYGKVYKGRVGREPTDEVYARMHNGGPFGWKRGSTDDYWAEVDLHLFRIRSEKLELAAVWLRGNKDMKMD